MEITLPPIKRQYHDSGGWRRNRRKGASDEKVKRFDA
jgi:hypothetical protein